MFLEAWTTFTSVRISFDTAYLQPRLIFVKCASSASKHLLSHCMLAATQQDCARKLFVRVVFPIFVMFLRECFLWASVE